MVKTGINIDIGLGKLADVVKDVYLAKTRPARVVANATAEVEARKILALGERELKNLLAVPDPELPALPPPRGILTVGELNAEPDPFPTLKVRVALRTEAQEIRRESNIERVIVKTADALRASEVEANGEPVDPDKAARMVDGFKDVSDETLQDLWAKVVTAEVIKPDTISVRTLEVVKGLSPAEARTFEKWVRRSTFGGGFLLYGGVHVPEPGAEFYSHEESSTLTDAGLLRPEAKSVTQRGRALLFNYRSILLLLSKRGEKTTGPLAEIERMIKAYQFTIAGQEIAWAIHRSLNLDLPFLNDLVSRLEGGKWEARTLTAEEALLAQFEEVPQDGLWDRARAWSPGEPSA